jgi:hypothetical protein
MEGQGKGSIIGAVVAFVALLVLSVVMLIVGFVTNTLVPIYISICCGFLGAIALVILLVRLASYTTRRHTPGG